jgi:hypothetical protein
LIICVQDEERLKPEKLEVVLMVRPGKGQETAQPDEEEEEEECIATFRRFLSRRVSCIAIFHYFLVMDADLILT